MSSILGDWDLAELSVPELREEADRTSWLSDVFAYGQQGHDADVPAEHCRRDYVVSLDGVQFIPARLLPARP